MGLSQSNLTKFCESTGVTISDSQVNVIVVKSCRDCSFHHKYTMNPTAQSESHRENRADTVDRGSVPQLRQVKCAVNGVIVLA
ncbi:hypothetical protein FCV25MIE_28934, partial [Fagus crenata]